MSPAKSSHGNFFEDFRLDQEFVHAVPRTVSTGDTALYSALYGMRFPIQSSDAFATSVGLPCAPVDNLLLFHIVFGKTVPDISLNAIANLGYADCRFLGQVYPGESVTARSRVIGLRENANRKTGIVYVRSTGYDRNGRPVLTFVRWVMVAKRDIASPSAVASVPELPRIVSADSLLIDDSIDLCGYNWDLAGSPHAFEDYRVGEKIDHVDGMTIEEAEHQIATRLYQNTAKGHFDERLQRESRFGRRIVYGGHIMSLARSLSFNGLGNAAFVAAINGGRHVNAATAGDTIYCWSEIVDRQPVAGRTDLGALRIRTTVTKDVPFMQVLESDGDDAAVILLELDYWALLPARHASYE
ncbi:MAG: hypothetical protein DCC69_14490 [Hyphomicrobiales bacterium]|nr:MAG: hypothetical protein DCC69_14490 [Hyphomicrobiales bacterium]